MTLDQLKRKRSSIANRCYFCEENKENIEHLLIHCPKVWTMWTSLLATVGFKWVIPWSVRDLICSWSKIQISKDGGE